MADTCLRLCQCMERRLWWDAHPLRQFESLLEPEVRGQRTREHAHLDDMSCGNWRTLVLTSLCHVSTPGCACARTQLLMKLEDQRLNLEFLQDMSASEIGAAVRHPARGESCLQGSNMPAVTC